MAGGSLRYAGARAAGFMGIPQGRLEKGKLAGERQTAMDNMIKTLEDNYDEQINIGGQDIGLTRDLFKNYASDIEVDSSGSVIRKDSYGYYDSLSDETQTAVRNTQQAYNEYRDAQGAYDELRLDTSGTVTKEQLAKAWETVEGSRTKYQSLKSSTDKKIDTDFNTRMLTKASEDETIIKAKGRNAVKRSIETYDNVASSGYKTTDFIKGTKITTPNGKRKTSNTKFAGDHYSAQQDRTTYSRSGSSWNNSNSRGSGSSK